MHGRAAMIYEDRINRRERLNLKMRELRAFRWPGAVTLLERQHRHGHRPGIVLVEGREALAKQLERSLFERGFEVLVLEGGTLSSQALPLLLKPLWSAGCWSSIPAGDRAGGPGCH